jgi:Ca2+-binding EF-hand superfamily protein
LRAKLEAAFEAFSTHDLNKDEHLSKLEFIACLRNLGVQTRFSEEKFQTKVDECFQRFDKDNNGTIDREEFVTFYNWIIAKKEKFHF